MKKKIITMLLICMLLTAIAACTDTSDNSSTADTEATQVTAEKKTNSELTNKGTVSGKYDVEIVGARKGTDYEGKPCVIVTYNFTNNSDSNASFIGSVSAKAFQNSVECEDAIIIDGSVDIHPSIAEVQQGGTITVEEAYCLKDETNVVTIQACPLFSFTDEVNAQMEFNPAQ